MSTLDKIRSFPEKTRTALAYFDEPILICDPKGILVYINPQGEKNFGLDYRMAVGRSIAELFPETVAQSLLLGLERLKKTVRAQRILVAENERGYFAHLNPIHQDNKLLGAIICLRTETDEEMLQRLNRSLFESLLDQVYKPINQLTMLFSRELSDQKEFEKLYMHSQELVKKSISALNHLIDISPILIGKIRLAKNRFHPLRVLKLAVRSFRARAERKNILLLRLDHKELGEVLGDEAKINRVLVIFLDQFLEYTPSGEIITLSVDLKNDPTSTLIYSISSTGMKEEYKSRILPRVSFSSDYMKLNLKERQFQINQIIASRLIWAMNGEMKMASLDNGGICLSFALPIKLAEA